MFVTRSRVPSATNYTFSPFSAKASNGTVGASVKVKKAHHRRGSNAAGGTDTFNLVFGVHGGRQCGYDVRIL